MTKGQSLFIQACLLVLLGFFIWDGLRLREELDRMTISHASFVVHCRNVVAVLSEKVRPEKCQPGFIATRIGVNSSTTICVEECAWCVAVHAKMEED